MANPFSVQPLGGLQNVRMIGQGMAGIAGNIQADRQAEQRAQVQQQFAEAMERNDPQEIARLSMQYPEIGEAAMGGIKFANEATKSNLRESMQRVVSGEDPIQVLQDRIQMVQAQDGDPSDSMRELEMAQQDPEGYRQQVESIYAVSFPKEYSAFRSATGQDSSAIPAGIREFESKVEAAGLKPGTEGYQRAALVALGLEPRAGISASERIASDPELARRVADLERQTQAAKETGKLETQRQLLPEIKRSVKEAEQEAASRGEALSEYGRAQASMPGLQEVVGKLKTLSDVATYTMGGKVFDTVVKELGFGATEGATARAKMESLVNNQILPLLRDTFGAQFTEREGEQLRRTMLDIDAAPEQKKEILDSFIEQKMRDLEMKQGRVEELGGEPQSSSQMSDEEADAFINQMLGQ